MAAPGVDGASMINVAVRVRPFTIREAAQLTRTDDGPLFLGDGSLAAVPAPQMKSKGIRSVIKVVDEKCLVFDPPDETSVQRFGRHMPMGKRVKDQTFGFDRVFDENTTQGDVYEATTRNLLDSVMDGFNATVFAYGATGCGKTHTITGTAQQPGIIFLTMQELFEKVDEVQTDKESEITLSYLEIYNETIRDLLSPGAGGKQGLMLREDANQVVSVAGLSSHKPQNVAEVMDMVIRGNACRTQSPTEANATSSRSHAVLQVNISLKDRNASVNEPVTMATLSIIDLAGSERASATKNRGERLLEGANINKSLLALGSCINALCDPRKKNHVPYRNSKLTRLLKFSLGGNCRTVMIVCVSPSSQHFDETQNTLRYANRAKNIQTKSVRNVYNVDRHVKDYLKKIDEQMNRINELTAQQKQYEDLAFVKFRKAEAKRSELAHEGVLRIRTAFEHSVEERKERVNNMRRLRQIERRIAALSGWIGAFDQVCETREEEEPPASLSGMRKTAQGILVELEGSRQHYHQRLAKSNWTRAVDTALQDGLRQLQGLDGAVPDSMEEASLRKEVELLKYRADLDANISVLDDSKNTEAALMQVMLTAHFETIAILNQILQMSEEDAVAAARNVLGKLLQSCTEATGQVIKPDGGLQIIEAVAPTRHGTPRKRKQVPLIGPSPLKSKIRPSLAPASSLPPHMAPDAHQTSSPHIFGGSPMRPMGSPRRRVKLGGARKGITFGNGTPKKKSPTKKRAVRWRDDAEEGAPLAEFQTTPKPLESSPVEGEGTGELPTAPVLRHDVGGGEAGSSPLPTAPVPSSEARRTTGTGRFAAGFLAKKGDGSPIPLHAPPALTLGAFSSSDASSPLREMAANSAPSSHRLSHHVSEASSNKENDDHASLSSGSDSERSLNNGGIDKETAGKIRSAMKLKRTSSIGGNGHHHGGTGRQGSRESAAHRRRSPTASASSRDSPPPDNVNGASGGNINSSIFSASHARRMVKSEREEALRSVLSPRTQPVVKQASGPMAVRRSLQAESGAAGGGGGMRDGMAVGASGVTGAPRGHVRVSSIVPGSASRASGVGGKAAWR
ncbi:tubulin-dependent ATPase kip3 [Recurvomyces mirabilis]|uniref:Tubulin-dependent ATPase kip3 n=1 Tax=Recurvomyces mirabilis TaxID=574656 RepID=A0AAE1C3G3_9PEZI|nr:tubulin-dependent ATPase kip3 [Recurvomyces mirabilis]KAK5154435.1 tubulin-dependent ATPase kip3 [Recurvomyces mirabilis]